MRPTAKDLAEAAGVSLATVDRVLNERPNVSPKAARKVAEAIERIGFVRNPAAVALARNKTYSFRFVLPTSGDQYLAELIARAGEAKEILRLYQNDDSFHASVNQFIHDFEAMLRLLIGARDGSAISVTLLSSDIGKLYVALAQAIDRLRN